MVEKYFYRSISFRVIAAAAVLFGAAHKTLHAAVTVDTVKSINSARGDANPYAELEKDPASAITAIGAAMRDTDEATRRLALRLSEDAKFRSPTYIETFKSLAKDPSENVRSDLVSVLSVYGEEGDKIVYSIFRDKQQPESIRASALSFLRSFRTNDAVVKLANEAIEEEALPLLRITAAKLIKDSDPIKARTVARSMLALPPGAANSEAIRILSKVGDGADLERLKTIRDDPKQPQVMKLKARDAVRVLSIEMLPTSKDRALKLKEIADGADRLEAFWAVRELLSRHDEDSTAVLKGILANPNHSGYWTVKNSGYFPN